MEEYITVQEAAEQWGLSVRRVQTLCNENRIEGAKKFGTIWAIPKDASRPKDGRLKSGKYTNWRKNE
ncbi:MAG: helix-turn-helix domain-containing protein [Agathobacter sp.]|nr:helix-turn-helix domain-containing protein [Agathobacter sp.]